MFQAYISVVADEKRLTITTTHQEVDRLSQQLRLSGIHVTDLGLNGRFHYEKHRHDVEQLIQNLPLSFRFPDASKLAFASRSHAGGQYLNKGDLHDLALHAILVEQCQWLDAISLIHSSKLVPDDASVLCFGPERSIPPTIARTLGSRVISTSRMSTSDLARYVFAKQDAVNGSSEDEGIAVVGMACKLPGAEDLEEYWDILTRGESQHTEVPSARFSMETPWRPSDGKRTWYGNFISDPDVFDHKFFKKSPREMESTDPQHRLMLQTAYQAVEQSGYFQSSTSDKHIGCFLGVGNVDYEDNIACYPGNAYCATGNLKSFTAGKVSHYFGWTGPSLTIDTACSSSSVAIHQACRSILHGECTAALAGGVNIITSPDWYHNLAGASFLSPTGQCKPFDTRGDGYCRGEGVGAVMLKKLSAAIRDGDQVFAVIASTAVYQNRNCTAITVPDSNSLADLFYKVVESANLNPHDISVVEAHGTGTPVGDPAEYRGIQKVFGAHDRPREVFLSSVKGLIGHTECASGVASLLKVILMMNEGYIPPQASFTSANPSLGIGPEDKIRIPTSLRPWKDESRSALINNYGASGSNASMVVRETGRSQLHQSLKLPENKSYPFWFSGNDERSLKSYASKLLRSIKRRVSTGTEVSVSNLSFQLFRQSNRALPSAFIIQSDSLADLESKVEAIGKGNQPIKNVASNAERPVILCFGGQVSRFVGLDQEIYDSVAIFRKYLDQCDAMLKSIGLGSIYPEIFQKSPIDDLVKLHSVLFALQYSSARSWIDCGVKVAAVVGHSFGELTALCVSNTLSLRDAITLITSRARIIQQHWGGESGAMMAVEANLSDIEHLVEKARKDESGKSLTIACYNGPNSFTIAGTGEAVDSFEASLKADSASSSIRVKKLNVTNAFHCDLVEPLVGDLEALGETLHFNKPTIPLETATREQGSRQFGKTFISEHLRNPVFFHHAVQRLAKQYPSAIWLEAGSNSTVTQMASRALDTTKTETFPINLSITGSFDLLTSTTAALWQLGLDVTFWPHHATQVSSYQPIILPPYQFERSRHWMDLKQVPPVKAAVNGHIHHEQKPQGLTIFKAYQDNAQRSALFQVNESSERLGKLVAGHIMAGAAAVYPGIFQMELILHALTSLRPELADLSYLPEIREMQHHNPILLKGGRDVWIELEATDSKRTEWSWRITSTASGDKSSTYHTTGRAIFRPADSPELNDELQGLARWVKRRQCVSLLENRDVDDVLKGRNVYRAFSPVIDYNEVYRHVQVIVGSEHQSAGHVVRARSTETWLDSVLTDCFCQVAGIFINLMTDRTATVEGGIFVCDGIKRWVRSPQTGRSSSQPEAWDVLALHHPESEKKYTSDVFVFDPRDGSIVEVVFGISYQWVSTDGIRKVLSRNIPLRPDQPAAQVVPYQQPSTLFQNSPNGSLKPVSGDQVNGKQPDTQINGDTNHHVPDVEDKTYDILCKLSGVELEEIGNSSDLVELGVDSLMSMELSREVESAFGVSLETSDLMDLTDVQSLVSCIQKSLGQSAGTTNGTTNGTVNGTTNGITNGATDHNTQASDRKVNGFQTTSIQNGSPLNGTNGRVNDKQLQMPMILEAFEAASRATDEFIVNGEFDTYYDSVMPRSTRLCVVYILDAFEELGCPIRSAAPFSTLKRIPYLPKHQQFIDLIYDMLADAGLIEQRDGNIIRTAVPAPSESAQVLFEALLKDEPVHAAEHKLTAMIGPKFADCLIGKADGLHLIFGTAEGREVVSDVYAKSPINRIWIEQLEFFLEKLLSQLPPDGEPLRVLEMGAGTGGTTVRMAPLFARLGIPVKYTMSDLSTSLVAAARKRFKQYPFMEFKAINIENEPDRDLLESQHIVLATNCVHATRDLTLSTSNIRKLLKPDGFLLLLEMTEQVPWVDFIFGLLEGWWLFNDGRKHALSPAGLWRNILTSVGYGHVDWTTGTRPESNLQRLIIATAAGLRYDSPPVLPPPPIIQTDLMGDVGRQATIDTLVRKYTEGFDLDVISQKTARSSSSRQRSGRTVLVTGATGSLGSHLVAHLVQLHEVVKVICFNRPTTADPETRQQRAFDTRGLTIDNKLLYKLSIIESDTAKSMLGLSSHEYSFLVQDVTDIIHNAWPMSLTRTVSGYETQFKVMRNLLTLLRDAQSQSTGSTKFGFQFISSIGVVGLEPLLRARSHVPEEPVSANSVLPVGYAEAKLVCERMLQETLNRHPKLFRSMAVRIAQISGSTTTGYWNQIEHLVSLFKSSHTLGSLPNLTGTLSWCPVDIVATTLGELLFSEATDQALFHIENPSRQSWPKMIHTIADCLGISHENVVPFGEWLSRVRQYHGSTDENPAGRLIDFFDDHFLRMTCGDLVLDTMQSRACSKTLRYTGPIEKELVKKYFTTWQNSGFLYGI